MSKLKDPMYQLIRHYLPKHLFLVPTWLCLGAVIFCACGDDTGTTPMGDAGSWWPDAAVDATTPDATPDAAAPDATPDAAIPDATPDAAIPDATPDAEPTPPTAAEACAAACERIAECQRLRDIEVDPRDVARCISNCTEDLLDCSAAELTEVVRCAGLPDGCMGSSRESPLVMCIGAVECVEM